MHPLPPPNRGPAPASNEARDQIREANSIRPPASQPSEQQAAGQAQDSTTSVAPANGKKKRRHRGGKKRRNRRPSFVAPSETSAIHSMTEGGVDEPLVPPAPREEPVLRRPSKYRRMTGILSDESLDSEALLDHRDQPLMRPRRDSRLNPALYSSSHRYGSQSTGNIASLYHGIDTQGRRRGPSSPDDSDHGEINDRSPLIPGSVTRASPIEVGYGLFKTKSHTSTFSAGSKQQRRRVHTMGQSGPKLDQDYDVNNPPSVPGSPDLTGQYDDVMVPESNFLTRSPDSRRNLPSVGNKDALIDIDQDTAGDRDAHSAPASPRRRPEGMPLRRRTTLPVEEDVCFPTDAVSEMAEEEFERSNEPFPTPSTRRRHKRREWPQLWVLDEWSREEKEERDGERRAKKVSEPVLVEGRLRPSQKAWHRIEDDAPYRYTYFNEEFETTIHSQTISELVPPGGSFRELFIPDPPELSDSSDSEEENLIEIDDEEADNHSGFFSLRGELGREGRPDVGSRFNSMLTEAVQSRSREAGSRNSHKSSGNATPLQGQRRNRASKPKKYGPRPTFWLDVMCPTDQEMRVLSVAFGLHALTSEDIMMQEAREKVELFRNYYFINYRTFEQDANSEDYLEPINMYVCVFRDGILTFHFSQIPHPANVRRRIRQLSDYLILSADWISYAIIDDITDVYQPLITNIEQEVDDIDQLILRSFHTTHDLAAMLATASDHEKQTDGGEVGSRGVDMLRRIGQCRKKVMSLYRLLGNKADVIKGFAKRCNEQWEVAPKSEIGLYLGDIQDHILTMTASLSHYENLLSRAHSNYLAHASIRMNERQEHTSDVLGKLTVLGTIVLPMNIICGMWGMNVKVPGQEADNLIWFWSIAAGLVVFAVVCYFYCRRVYGIV